MDVQLLRLCICLFFFLRPLKSALVDPFSHGSIVYTREQLLALCNAKVLPPGKTGDPQGIKQKEKGMQCWNKALGEEKMV